jgi:hypothetical protein
VRKNWKSIAELLGITAVVASLVFVGLQLQQAQDIAIAEMNASLVANVAEENNAVMENVNVWMRGNADENLTSAEKEIYLRMLTNMNNRFFFIVQQQERLGVGDNAVLDVAEFAGFLYENPGATRVWRAREERLGKYRGLIRPNEEVTSDWIELVESYIDIFEQRLGAAVQ